MVAPITMPADGVASQYFEPEGVDFSTQRTDGRVNGVRAGWPLWHARFSFSQSMKRRKSDEWRAFVARLRGQQRPFFGADQDRPFPLAYPRGFAGLTRAGGGAFDGSAAGWSINEDGDVITPTGLPAALQLQIGDYGMFRWETGGEPRRSLHRAVLDSTANGSGVLALTVEPPVPNLVPGDAVFDLARPACIMKLKPETKIGELTRTRRVDGQVHAIQDLRE